MSYTTINKSTEHFNTKLYTGTGSAQNITGVGFQPDLVWTKKRNASGSHYLTDAVRGVGEALFTDDTSGEYDYGSAGVTAFNSDGWSVGNNAAMNGSGSTQVGWNWKAGTTSGLSGGTITPSGYSINATSGFGIYKYTGNGTGSATISHGLGTTPNFVIIKRTSDANDWFCWGDGFTRLALNNGNSDYGNHDLTLSSTLVTLPSTVDTAWNTSGQTYIMYVFSNRTGYQKTGSYTGNGNADGTFVYTGFKPAWLMVKRTTVTGENWYIYDNTRPTFFNPNKSILIANQNLAEYNNFGDIDFLSNGFKIRTTNNSANDSGETYIFMAFGQSLVGSNNVPCTAR